MKSITFGRTFSEAIFISISQQHAKFVSSGSLYFFVLCNFFHGFQRRHLYLLWSVYLLSRPIISFAKSYLSRPGFEPGLLRPQRSVLTFRPSGRKEFAMKSIAFGRTFSEANFISISQQHAKFSPSGNLYCFLLCNFLELRSVSFVIVFVCFIFEKCNKQKVICSYRDSNLGYCRHNAVS